MGERSRRARPARTDRRITPAPGRQGIPAPGLDGIPAPGQQRIPAPGLDGIAAGRSRAGAAARDPAEQAREICLRELAVRPRTRAELAKAMRRRGIADDVAAEVLDRYDDVGIIDDEAFARAWVTSRHHGRGLARRALASELRRKGVAADAVDDALGELDPQTEEETARALVARRLPALRGVRPEARVRRLVAMLAGKGYPPGLAFRVVKDALAADADTAEFAEVIDPDAVDDEAQGD